MSTNNTEISDKKILLYIFIAALLLRALFFFTMNVVIDKNLDQDFEYGIIARSLIAGEGYSVPLIEQSGPRGSIKTLNTYRPTADQLPFYPTVLAVIYYFSTSPLSFLIVKFIQAIVSSFTCIIIYKIALKLFNQRAATIAGFVSVIYPLFVITTPKMIPEIFFTFWLSMSMLYLIILKSAPSLKHSLIAGILIGVTLLNSNVVVTMIPFIGIWLLTLDGTWLERFKRTLLVMVTAFLIVSPWLVRNYFAFNEFPLMKSTMGVNFWLGNNPRATGTFSLPSSEPMDSILPNIFYESLQLSETEQDKRLYTEAMEYVKTHPMHFVRLSLKRFYYFSWFPPDNLISKEGRLYKRLFKIPYGFILISCAAGIILSLRENSKDTFLLCAIIFSVVVLYSIFIVGHMRYRMPIEPYMILFAAFAISSLIDKYSRRFCR